MQLEDYEIDENPRFEICRSNVDAFTGEIYPEEALYQMKNGNTIYGVKAYGNFELFNVTILPIYGGVGCFVQTSIPKFYTDGESNTQPLSNSDTFDVISALGTALKGVGVKTNVWDAKFSRVDTFSNIKLESPFEDYAPLFNTMRAKRKKRISYGVKMDTFLWYNSQSEMACYNKDLETAKRKLKRGIRPERLKYLDYKIARFEHRFKTGKSLKGAGFKKVDELRHGKLDDLKLNYIKEFKDNLFKLGVKDMNCWMTKEIKKEMTEFRNLHGRNWFSKFLKYRGLSVCVQMMSIPQLKTILQEVSGDRNKAWRFEQEMDRVLAYKDEDSVEWKKINEMYIEVKTKFLNQSLN
ncbi:MAG: hypothetical protein ACE5IR_11815 [bacterium]